MVIDAALRDRIDAEIARFPVKRGGLLGALRAVQGEHGWVSAEAARELAAIFEIRPVEVQELVTFYNMLHSEPRGRHEVNVCTNLSCALRGAIPLLRGLEEHLGIRVGETTGDGRVSLGQEECLGACAWAPVVRVDEHYHENLDLEGARRVLDALE